MTIPFRSARSFTLCSSRPILTSLRQDAINSQSRCYPGAPLPPPEVNFTKLKVHVVPKPERISVGSKAIWKKMQKDNPTEWILPIPESAPKGTFENPFIQIEYKSNILLQSRDTYSYPSHYPIPQPKTLSKSSKLPSSPCAIQQVRAHACSPKKTPNASIQAT
jgi:hypothetical protein